MGSVSASDSNTNTTPTPMLFSRLRLVSLSSSGMLRRSFGVCRVTAMLLNSHAIYLTTQVCMILL